MNAKIPCEGCTTPHSCRRKGCGKLTGECNQQGLNFGAIEGLERAQEHAEQEDQGWSDRALESLRAYIANHKDVTGWRFIAPHMREWAYERGLTLPPTNYAWGAVLLRARRTGLIRADGYTQYGDHTMHTQSVRVWKPA